ncbi:MAG: fimbrillin family protein [Bacteroides sp.]|nr:fimbrillin family protein [Bacteroides sp.]
MIKAYTYLKIFVCLVIFYGCDQTHTGVDQLGNNEIMLSSVVKPNGFTTTRATDFPNSGSIGVVAATELSSIPHVTMNWTNYPDISNAEATATSVVNGVYSFNWETQKYWPFDGSDLYFMAYSPIATGDELDYYLSTDHVSLFIALTPNMPDIMYASNNTNPQPYNKTNPLVDLGQFKHALSQLTIEVVAGENMPSSMRVSNLSVTTPARTASLSLPDGDNGLQITTASIPYTGTLANGLVDFQNGLITNWLYLFPGTQDVTEISITLVDTATNQTFSRDYMMSFFINEMNDPILLERAKNTTLRMIVEVTEVENPTLTLSLQGLITDWVDKGNFGVVIN